MKEKNYPKAIDLPVFKLINKAGKELKTPVFVIGGYVRDYLLKNQKAKDIDIVALGSGIKIAQKTAALLNGKQKKITIYKNFGTAMLKTGDLLIEFVGARKESYRKDSRKPIVENGTMEDDQKRRDFTINALAISLNDEDWGNLIDPFNGLDDLKMKIIRTPLNPDITFSDDPLRMMRAIRFASQLNFKIHPETFEAIKRNKDRLSILSKERIIDEFNKIMSHDKPSTGLKLLFEAGLIDIFFPELSQLQGVEENEGKTHKDNFYHTLEVVDNVARESDNLWLRWAALLHDIGKPATKRYHEKNGWSFHGHEYVGSKMCPKIFKKLKLPLGKPLEYVKKLVLLSSRPIALIEENVTDSAVRRLLFEAGDDIDDLMLLCEADITTKNKKKLLQYKNNLKLVRKKLIEIEERDRIRNFQPPVSGKEIMKYFNLKPSKEVGLIKEAIKEAILEGKIQNNYDEAFAYMKKTGKKIIQKSSG